MPYNRRVLIEHGLTAEQTSGQPETRDGGGRVEAPIHDAVLPMNGRPHPKADCRAGNDFEEEPTLVVGKQTPAEARSERESWTQAARERCPETTHSRRAADGKITRETVVCPSLLRSTGPCVLRPLERLTRKLLLLLGEKE
jgi:hypothetical protein